MFANVVDTTASDVYAMEVLGDQIGNAATKEVVDHLAAAWEAENVKAIVRPDEERAPDAQTGKPRFAATYLARKKHFEALAAKKPQLGLIVSPDVARSELERYARVPMSEIIRDYRLGESEDPEQRKRSSGYARRINEFRACLGLEPLDFSKPIEKKESPDYEKKVAEFLAMSLGDRRRTVSEIVDRTLLGYIMSDDSDREVKAKAQERLFLLAMPQS
jgi:hypothetical protein